MFESKFNRTLTFCRLIRSCTACLPCACSQTCKDNLGKVVVLFQRFFFTQLFFLPSYFFNWWHGNAGTFFLPKDQIKNNDNHWIFTLTVISHGQGPIHSIAILIMRDTCQSSNVYTGTHFENDTNRQNYKYILKTWRKKTFILTSMIIIAFIYNVMLLYDRYGLSLEKNLYFLVITSSKTNPRKPYFGYSVT